jgi:hypothetical protein
MDERSARLAQKEAIFRAGNERIPAVIGDQLDTAPYVCECGDAECVEQVSLANAEYEAVRSHPARFPVVPGHQGLTAGEVVSEESPRFAVVEKRGEEGELVERADPRVGS